MPCPTHSLLASPSWQKLTKNEQERPELITLCLEEVHHITALERVREQISFLTDL